MPAFARAAVATPAPAAASTALAVALVAAGPVPLAAQALWRYERPLEARQTGGFANPLLTESSGVAASGRFPGVLWSHNDAGNDPLVFATDTSGADLGAFRVTKAKNVDWEDVALAPCGAASCLYLADTGDNQGDRRSAVIYRVVEPEPGRRGGRSGATAPAQALEFTYPDGPHDVEAMWVDPSGDVHLLTKEQAGQARHYRLPAAGWSSRDPIVADTLGTVPIRADGRDENRVTGAALSPDGMLVAVRTGALIYFFLRTRTGGLEVPGDRVACDVRGLEIQGEGITWLDDQRLVLTSERGFLPRGTASLVRCKLPRVPRAVRAR